MRGSAKALGLSQPAVTQCLAELERLVDPRLFALRSRDLRVTRAGREWLSPARRLLDAMAESSEAPTAARGCDEGVVRVAATAGAVGGALPKSAREHAAVTLHVRESDPEQ